MKHFIAYHDEKKAGGPLAEHNPGIAISAQPLEHVRGHVVWYITRSGGQCYLESVFIGGETGPAQLRPGGLGEGHYIHGVGGTGMQFDVPLALDEFPWFYGFLQSVGGMRRGVHETTDQEAIAAFMAFATAEGWDGPGG
jgi:hypothetical protein